MKIILIQKHLFFYYFVLTSKLTLFFILWDLDLNCVSVPKYRSYSYVTSGSHLCKKQQS